MAVFGIRSRTQPTISPQPSTIRTKAGMWVWVNWWAALGKTNITASIRMTIPSVHRRMISPAFAPIDTCLLSVCWLTRAFGLDLFQPVAGAGVQVEFVKLLQLANLFERCRAERRLAVEGVQHNAFQHVSE